MGTVTKDLAQAARRQGHLILRFRLSYKKPTGGINVSGCSPLAIVSAQICQTSQIPTPWRSLAPDRPGS